MEKLSRRHFLKNTALASSVIWLGDASIANARNSVEIEKSKSYENEWGSDNPFASKAILLPQSYKVDFWDLPRRIYFRNANTGEKADLYYFKDGKINPEHYYLASYLLRDWRQNKMVYIDIKVLDLMCAIQAWLKHFGYHNPIQINSGYRTDKTNASLEGAAKNSMHLQGRAIDFTVPGLNTRAIAQMALHFQAGGVGLYPNKNFIHVDSGRIRTWIK